MKQGTLFFLFLINCILSTVYAQKKLEKIPAHTVLAVDFTQHRHLKSLPIPLISTGSVKLSPQQGLIWKTVSPFPSTLVITPEGTFQLGENKHLISLSKSSQNSMIFTLLARILNGSFQGEIEGFKTINIPSQEKNWGIKLVPLNQALRDLLPAIDIHGNTSVFKVVIRRANGNYDEIFFTNHKIVKGENALTPQEQRWLHEK